MKDEDKTRQQLINELTELRQQIVKLGTLETEHKQMEEALKESTEEKTAILNSMLELVAYQDTEMKILWVNQAVSELFGLAAEQLVGHYCYEIGYQRSEPCLGCPVVRAYETGQSEEAEVATPDGKLWFMRGYPIRDAANRLVGVVKVALEITERKQMEEALRESEKRYRTVFENSGTATMIIEEDNTISLVNSEFEKLIGWPREEVEGCKKWLEFVSPEDLDRLMEYSKLRKIEPSAAPTHYEARAVDRQGNIKDILVTAALIPGTKRTVASVQDITERKRVEEKLQQVAEEWHITFNSISDLISIHDKDFKIVRVNQAYANAFKMKPEELVGRTCYEVVHNTKEPWPSCPFKRVLETQKPATVQFFEPHLGITLEINASPIFDDKGEISGIVHLAKDISERKQAEEELEMKAQLLDAANDGILLHDLDGTVIYHNKTFAKGHGYTPEELMGSNLRDLITAEYASLFNHRMKELLEKRENIYETATICRDGAIKPVEVHARVVESGGRKLILSVGRDITERKQAEEALLESEQKFKELANLLPQTVFETDGKGNLTFVNQQTFQATGYTPEDFNKGINAIQLVIPEDRDRVKKNIQRRLSRENIGNQEYTALRKDGSTYPIIVYSTPIIRDGKPIGLRGLIIDITERKQAEEQYRTLLENSPIGIYILQDGKFQFTNSLFQKQTGFNGEELLAMSPTDLVMPEDRQQVMENAVQMLKRNRLSPYEFRTINRAGEIRWNIETVSSITYNGKRATLGSFMDITERKQAEEREKQLQQELALSSRLASVGEMAAGIAHEINNPLTGIIGFAGLLMKKDIPEDARQDLDTIYDGAQRIAGITRRMLSYARQHKPERAPVDINDILKSTLAMRTYQMESSNIKLETRLAPDLPLTMADSGQIQQVFLNIILNAEIEMVQAHGGGNFLIKTERIDNTIRISFKDDGPGIAKENLDKIFNPFFTTREAGKGTGLGLSVSHGIITQHNGKIYAKSQPGKGATFFVELPVTTEAKQLVLTEPASESRSISGVRILIVDDEPLVQQFLSEVLTREGYKVESVTRGDDALERLGKEDYGVILLDIKLPGMSGIDIYKHLQKRNKPLLKRIVFITGDIMSKDTMAFISRTRALYITKPFSAEQIKEKIDSVFAEGV